MQRLELLEQSRMLADFGELEQWSRTPKVVAATMVDDHAERMRRQRERDDEYSFGFAKSMARGPRPGRLRGLPAVPSRHGRVRLRMTVSEQPMSDFPRR
jgi:hypothetical protein